MNKIKHLFWLSASLLFIWGMWLSTSILAQDTQDQQAAFAAMADQSPCSELIRNGIYNHFRSIYTHSSASAIQTEVCSAYSRYLSDKQSGKVGATYKLFGGSVSYSREQIEVVGTLMCSSGSSQSFDSSSLSIVSDTVSEAALMAYRECVGRYSDGLRITTWFRESDEGLFTKELRYVAPPGAPASTTITGISVSPQASFACEGPMLGIIGQRGGLATQITGLTCTRKLAAEPTLSRNGAYVLADAASVVIYTDAGTITQSFPPIVVEPPAPGLRMPIGSIIPFAGSSAEAEKMKAFGWWPADGSTVQDVQAHEWNGKATPNLMGQFLRGAPFDKVGGFGGSEKHKHEFSGRTTYEVEGTTKGPEGADNFTGKPNWNHKHDVSGLTSEQSHLPPYYNVTWMIKVK